MKDGDDQRLDRGASGGAIGPALSLRDPTCAAVGSEALVGAKVAALARLAAAGLPSLPAFVVTAETCARLRLALADAGMEPAEGSLGEHDPGLAALLRRSVEGLAAEEGAPVGAFTGLVRLSPKDPVPNLGAIPFSGQESFKSALLEALKLWEARKTLRRRAAAGAEDHCALLVQSTGPVGPRLKGLRLHDPESGEQAPAARLDGPLEPGRAKSPVIGAATPPDAALALAARAEAVLQRPLEIDLALDGAGAPSLIGARPLRLSTRALMRAAARMVADGGLTRDAALMMIEPQAVEELLHPSIDPDAERDVLASGVPASPGAAAGRLCLTAEAAEDCARSGEPAILARFETSPEDVHGMHAAAGVLTLRGGLTSHAAVVARGLGVPCVVGATEARIELIDGAPEEGALVTPDGRRIAPGDWITLDGSAGEALAGALLTRSAPPSGDFATLMGWADARRRLRVRANADTPGELATAVRLGVDGVGLCRTEHMFFDPERITAMREMILADSLDARRAVLERLLPMQRGDFLQIFEIMDGAGPPDGDAPPVTIRLLDPPLHEFLPQEAAGVAALADALGQPVESVRKRARELREFNPMLGKRGCRLGIAYPEIYEMQARAIFEAALDAEARTGRPPHPEIMIPLVSAVSELQLLEGRIAAVAKAVEAERGARVEYGVGIMVETPRAALLADQLAPLSTFFSFGTNDLTQMTYGLSRDDAGKLMRDYVEAEVFEADPFQTLDREGVGALIQLGVERGRAHNPRLDIGLCGEHGASPSTVAFCAEAGFDYVSCSPYRAPIARLAAAQAAIAMDRAAAADAADE